MLLSGAVSIFRGGTRKPHIEPIGPIRGSQLLLSASKQQHPIFAPFSFCNFVLIFGIWYAAVFLAATFAFNVNIFH